MMNTYDYCILADSDLPSAQKKGDLLGWDGLCLLNGGASVKPGWESTIDLVRGVLIATDNHSRQGNE